MATARLRTVLEELNRRGFAAPKNTGVVCRPKNVNGRSRPDLGWSQHAYGNAIDLSVNGADKQRPYLAALESMRLQGFPVGLILHAGNRPKDHTNHIHLEAAPSLTGTPACAGGPKLFEDLTKDEIFEQKAEQNAAIEGNIVSDFFLGLFGLEQQDLADLGIRIVFGLLAVLASGATILLIVNSFKGDIACTLTGKVKNVVS